MIDDYRPGPAAGANCIERAMTSYRNSDPRPPIMQGAPPPQGWRVPRADWDRPPWNRWSFQHVRELLPTVTVSRGAGAPSVLPQAHRDFGGVAFTRHDGSRATVEQMLDDTYTDGFMVVAGRQTLQGQQTTVPWLSKCDPNGQILWQLTGDAADNIASLAMFSATHFIGGGSTKDGMDTNALLRRFDDGGGEVWSAVHAGADGGPDSIAAVAVDGSGDIYVAGREFAQATSFDAWIARYSASGDEVWSMTVDGPVSGPDWGTAIAVSDEGWLVVGGRQDQGAGNGADAWTARYTADGAEVWTQGLNGPASGDDSIHGLAIDSAGFILAVGHQEVNGQGLDAWVAKYDGDGAEQWMQVIDGEGSGDDELAAVAVDGDDNVVSVGTVAIIEGFDTDVLLIKHAP